MADGTWLMVHSLAMKTGVGAGWRARSGPNRVRAGAARNDSREPSHRRRHYELLPKPHACNPSRLARYAQRSLGLSRTIQRELCSATEPGAADLLEPDLGQGPRGTSALPVPRSLLVKTVQSPQQAQSRLGVTAGATLGYVNRERSNARRSKPCVDRGEESGVE
jgi:hypothetical protein